MVTHNTGTHDESASPMRRNLHKTALWLTLGALTLALTITTVPLIATVAQSGVRAVVVNEAANVRTVPAIGADVIATVPSGFVFETVTGRSADSQWLRVDFNGDEGWVNITPLVILEGDISTLPVGDPRSIPFGGFESPRAGPSNATSQFTARVTNGLRVRAGPSQAYPTLANMFANTIVPITGRTRSNAWIQVVYEGTLGWVSAGFLELQGGISILDLPIDGIVADSPPASEATAQNYFDTLRLMLSRLDIAQGSLDNIRGKWTDAALNGRALCRDYPPRPSDFNIAQPLLAAYFQTLDPLRSDFNDAMFNLRLAIDLFIEVCNQPGTGNPVGQATVIGALDVVNLVDSQFASLRERLLGLIPPDREPGPDECLFVFGIEADILPVVSYNQIVRDTFDPADRSKGYCFDANAGDRVVIQVLQLSGGIVPFIGVSPFDNPTNFIVVNQGFAGVVLTFTGPVTITDGGRYLFILSDIAEQLIGGELAFVIQLVPATGTVPTLTYNADTDEVSLTFDQGFATPNPFVLTPTPTNQFSAGVGTCPSTAFTCNQLFTCQEAQACLAAGNTSLDPDGDGVPCPNLCAP